MSQDGGPAGFDRVPPQNLEAEQAVLGSMLLERAAVERAAEILKAEDFYRDAHRTIFEAIVSLADRDEPVDAITLSDELRSLDQFDAVGGQMYLLDSHGGAIHGPLTSNTTPSLLEEKAARSSKISGRGFTNPGFSTFRFHLSS